jgi:hypothetical protein
MVVAFWMLIGWGRFTKPYLLEDYKTGLHFNTGQKQLNVCPRSTSRNTDCTNFSSETSSDKSEFIFFHFKTSGGVLFHFKCHPEKSHRVARGFIFNPKIQILGTFGGSCNARCWYMYCLDIWSILLTFGLFCGHMVGIFCGNLVYFPPWYFVPRKIWQP